MVQRRDQVGMPSLNLLRELSDRHVLSRLAGLASLTRAEIATQTRLSKPTVSQSVARLLTAGVLAEAPRSSPGRGRGGVELSVRPEAGCAVVLHAGADGVVGERVGLDGVPASRRSYDLAVPTTSEHLSAALRSVAAGLAEAAPGPVRAVTLSVADPVDRHTGRVVQLPGSPFLVGELDAVKVLAPVLPVPPRVDNDVNWALRAEHDAGAAAGVDDVVYVYLGAGLGAALMLDGRLVRGHRGLAGEVAQLGVPGATGGRLQSGLGALGLLGDGAAVDLARMAATLDHDGERADAVVGLVRELVRSVCYLLDPARVVLAGPWGARLVARVDEQVGRDPGLDVEVVKAEVTSEPWLAGARRAVAQDLLEALLAGQ